jgi:cytochrome c oxidase subunit I
MQVEATGEGQGGNGQATGNGHGAVAVASERPTFRAKAYDWLTTTDHKKIGILYIITAFFFFVVAGLLAEMIRAELARPGLQFVDDQTYNQLFTMHGTIMIFLFVMPMFSGFANFLVPLMIGAPDVAFPRINALSFWMVPVAGLVMISGFLVKGGAAAAGWTGYAPLSEQSAQLGEKGQDLWIVALIIIAAASLLGSINFITTILKMRAPGMTMFRMPIFVWNTLVTSLLGLLAIPVLSAGLIMLFIDRNLGGSFFDPSRGGNAILWQNVFWFFGHPEVYILILPAFGIVSEIIPVFSRKPLFGYRAFVFATLSIGALSFAVWAHHMFATGAVLLPFFSIMTFLISVPTGVKMFNWIATMWQGKIKLDTPMLFAIGFLLVFLIGGINGAFAAIVPFDFAITDTYFVVAHLHYVLVGGSVFAIFAGFYFWIPKMTGRALSEGLGKLNFWLLFIGVNLTFFPMHTLGLNGMQRRIADYPANAGLTGLNMVATIGAVVIALSVLAFVVNFIVSMRKPPTHDVDPWEANTLEWATSSPPPPQNFTQLIPIRSERPVFDFRHAQREAPPPSRPTEPAEVTP